MPSEATPRKGPLAGLKGVLLGGIGPAPYAAMLLADLGAEICRIERPQPADAGNPLHPPIDPFSRGQKVLRMDLKTQEGRDAAWKQIDSADILIEGFRPGTMERMGFSPEDCHARNPQLVIARITGWGQAGPLAQAPGHDINYLGLTGALAAMAPRKGGGGRALPLNLLADFAGGGLWACFGILAAIRERSVSGLGQVVDAAMVDGVLSLMGMAFHLHHFGGLDERPGHSLLDGGAHFYDTYACADGEEVAVAAIEPQFYEQLCGMSGLVDDRPEDRFEAGRWPGLKRDLVHRLAQRSRHEWSLDPSSAAACVTPLLKLHEVAHHPHHQTRGSFMQAGALTVPAPGPRFSRTPAGLPAGYTRAEQPQEEGNSNER